MSWNVLGGFLRALSMTVIGALLGGVPFIVENIDVLVTVLVLGSVLPLVVGQLRNRYRARRAAVDPGAE